MTDLTAVMMSMIGSVSTNFISSRRVQNIMTNACWSFRQSIAGSEELILSSTRALRYFVASGDPVSLGDMGPIMAARQDRHRQAMVDSCIETHSHVANLRQIPPPLALYVDSSVNSDEDSLSESPTLVASPEFGLMTTPPPPSLLFFLLHLHLKLTPTCLT